MNSRQILKIDEKADLIQKTSYYVVGTSEKVYSLQGCPTELLTSLYAFIDYELRERDEYSGTLSDRDTYNQGQNL